MTGAEIREDILNGPNVCNDFMWWWRDDVYSKDPAIAAKKRPTYQDDMVAEYTDEELESLYARWLVERSET